jgi:hypothetical protein
MELRNQAQLTRVGAIVQHFAPDQDVVRIPHHATDSAIGTVQHSVLGQDELTNPP